MKFVVQLHGSPLAEFDSLTAAYVFMRDQYELRWPRSMWGYQEAAAHGLAVVGQPELTPEQAREIRNAMRGEP